MAEYAATEQAKRLIRQGLADEGVETATGLSLTAIIGLRAECAASASGLAALRRDGYESGRLPYTKYLHPSNSAKK